MDYRQFNLVNDQGETYRLTLSNKYGAGFLHEVKNLGTEEATTFQQIGNRFGLLTDVINQRKINGIINFFNPRSYESYMRFALFCQHKPLKMYYRTPAGEFWRDGIVTKIEKSESAESLKAAIEFTATSLWYQNYKVTGTTEVDINSDSINASGCHIAITGVMASPTWSQTVNGETEITGVLEDKTEGGVTVSAAIAAGETLHIRTDVIPYEIYKTDGNGVKTDMYKNSKWDTERFCLIRYGLNVITCSAASSVTVEGRREYETV